MCLQFYHSSVKHFPLFLMNKREAWKVIFIMILKFFSKNNISIIYQLFLVGEFYAPHLVDACSTTNFLLQISPI